MSKSPAAKIEIEGVRKDFRSSRGENINAIETISLGIAPGEFLSVVGPSGCGKSTLLNIIAGFDYPSEGRILVDGVPITGPGPQRGVVFQDYALFPWLTVAGNVGFGPASMGLPAAQIDAARQSQPRHGPAIGRRASISTRAFRRHAAKVRPCPMHRQRPRCLADGRAARRVRCADAQFLAGRIAADLDRGVTTAAEDRRLRDPRYR